MRGPTMLVEWIGADTRHSHSPTRVRWTWRTASGVALEQSPLGGQSPLWVASTRRDGDQDVGLVTR